MSDHRVSPEKDHTPTCRACYAATLTPDERDRLVAEPVTSGVYLCPRHQHAINEALSRLPVIQYVNSSARTDAFRKMVTPPGTTAGGASE